MATIKVILQQPATPAQQGTIIYRILHDRRQQQIVTTHRLAPHEWDERRSAVRPGTTGARRDALLLIRDAIRHDVERLGRIIRRLEDDGFGYSAYDVAEAYRDYLNLGTLQKFGSKIIETLRTNGRVRTSETYYAAIKSFMKFRHGADIMLDDITAAIMEAYEGWHRERGNVANTISFYMRILRAIYNRAVECGMTEDRHPFRHVYTGVDKTVKRALPLATVRKIRMLDLTADPAADFARNVFILSFMLRGMSFVDMAFLKKTDLQAGHVIYRWRKTGQCLTIKWTPEMQKILDRYAPNETVYLLPIIRNPDADPLWSYRNAAYRINRHLKRVGEIAGLEHPLTLYVARHSWASIARAQGVPLGVISEGMGHDNESTTRIYLACLDTSAVDRANSKILRSL